MKYRSEVNKETVSEFIARGGSIKKIVKPTQAYKRIMNDSNSSKGKLSKIKMRRSFSD